MPNRMGWVDHHLRPFSGGGGNEAHRRGALAVDEAERLMSPQDGDNLGLPEKVIFQ